MKTTIFLVAVMLSSFISPAGAKKAVPRILIFSKTAGYHHNSIPAGIAAIQKLGTEHGFTTDTTTNAEWFTKDKLKQYKAVIFLSTTGDVLNAAQQQVFEEYIRQGGGFVGVHAAADTEYEWPWYNKLVGAWFLNHPGNPNVRQATISVTDHKHPSTKELPDRWQRTDEWYNYKDINPALTVIATLDETTYEGGQNGPNHPIAWYHTYEGGRAFYTGGGHTVESFAEPLFLKHLLGGITYALNSR